MLGGEEKIRNGKDQVRRSPDYVCRMHLRGGSRRIFWKFFLLQVEVMFYNLVIINSSYRKKRVCQGLLRGCQVLHIVTFYSDLAIVSWKEFYRIWEF